MLGMILVVHTSIGGDKLIFRYPTVTRNKVSDETLMAFKQQHPLTTMNPNQPGLNKSSNETEGNMQDQSASNNLNLQDKHLIYNLPSVVLTPILTPKLRLCDQSFELTIENTTFVGYPTSLTNLNDDIISSSSSSSSSKKSDESSNVYSKFNNRTQQTGCEDRPKGSQVKPDGTNGNVNVNGNGGTTNSKNHQYDEITLFNLVFIISANNRELSQKKILDSFKRISMQLSAALKHEQIRCNYITNQVHEMLIIREKWLTEQTLETNSSDTTNNNNTTNNNSTSNNSPAAINNSNTSTTSNNNNNNNNAKSSHQDLTNRIIEKSSLAREIRDIFIGLLEKGETNIKINNWIQIHASLNNPDHYPLYPVRTYHALLPFTGDDSLQLPIYDSSPALLKLLEVARPIKSFRELQIETDIPLAQIYRLASHLVYWRKAKIINMMTKNNYYILNPNSKASLDYILFNKKFLYLFPDFKLPDILQRFSAARPLADHISKFLPPYHAQFLQIVGWLIQHDLIVQLYTFIHLIIPLNTQSSHFKSNKHHISNSNNSSNNNNNNFYSNSSSNSNQPLLYPPPQFPLVPSTFAPHEKTFFENIDDNTKSYQLFKRLSPYFRGLHHIEEIMWRENISRDELNKILRKYKNVLVQVIHEAPEYNNSK